jgi:hypothetical protein
MAARTSRRFYSPKHWTLEQRLDHYIDKSGGPDACWPWTASTNTGYGQMTWKRKPDRAHRLMWVLHHGPIPPDKPHILHRCDNPPCCNPAHLWAGTNADNIADMVAKKRARGGGQRGEDSGNAKLTLIQVRAIRAATGMQRDTAKRFGVSLSTVNSILRGRNWRHLV